MNEVYYRLPETSQYHHVWGEAEKLYDVGSLAGKQGFVFAPFEKSDEHPLVLIHADHKEAKEVGNGPIDIVANELKEIDHHEEYKAAFMKMYALIDGDTLEKVVLARRSDVVLSQPLNVYEVFLKACQMYPHQMIALINTDATGTWLMATPELLLGKDKDRWTTMALAGTMSTPGPWDGKNVREQAYVARYIRNCLSRRCYLVNQKPVHTTMAAKLYHLRTDFEFSLSDDTEIVKVLDDLFPTPAVCGMPKERAMEVIDEYEHFDRKYYSGFCGPLNLTDKSHPDASLYVSLRCMEIEGVLCHLYAGGGLLKESDEEKEWRETAKKMETIKATFR
jgi:isochorismate synthase